MDGTTYDILSLFADGGAMMFPLVLCSLIALGVIIAKAYTLHVAHGSTKVVLEEAGEAAREGRFDDAMQIASDSPGPCAAIVLAGLRRITQDELHEGELEQAISTTGTIELAFLERGLVIMATIANVAPLMGFLGTVAGMILAFAAIESAGNVDATLVAGGIKVALLTTATGLVIAIPVNIAYNYFVTRIDRLIMDMEQGTQRILNIAWNMERSGTLRILSRKDQLVATYRAKSEATPVADAAPVAIEDAPPAEADTTKADTTEADRPSEDEGHAE